MRTNTTTSETHFFRNDLTGLFFRAGAWNESDPHCASHLNATEEAFLRLCWDCTYVTKFPSAPEPEPPTTGAAGFFRCMGRSQA